MDKPDIKKVHFNSIPEQKLTHANQLTIRAWNDIINVLRTQNNELTKYLKEVHEYLFANGAFVDTINLKLNGTNNNTIIETITNLIDSKLEERVGNLEYILNSTTQEILNGDSGSSSGSGSNTLVLEEPVLRLNNATISANIPENANEIRLQISTDGITWSDIEEAITSSNPTINLDTYISEVGTYYIRGYSYNISKNIRSEGYSLTVTYTKVSITPKLDTPTNLTYDSESYYLTWNAVSNATHYTVYSSKYNEELDEEPLDTVLFYSVDSTSVQLHLDPGTYDITVVAKANGYIESNISTPVHIVIETSTRPQYTISFNLNNGNGTVPSALNVYDGDRVDLTGSEYTEPDMYRTNYIFYGWGLRSDSTQKVSGIIIAYDTVLYAIWIEKPYIQKISGLSINGNILSWNSVPTPSASEPQYTNLEYRIYYSYGQEINRTLLSVTNNNSIGLGYYGSYLNREGDYFFVITASDPSYRTSEISDEVKYTVTLPCYDTPSINYSSATSYINWDDISATINGTTYYATYRIIIDDRIVANLGIHTTSYNLSGLFNSGNGTYTVGVQAVGLNGYIKDSNIATVNIEYTAPLSTYYVNFLRPTNEDTRFNIKIIQGDRLIDLQNSAISLDLNDTNVPITVIFEGTTKSQEESLENTMASHTSTVSCSGDYTYTDSSTIITSYSTDVSVTIYVSGSTQITLSNVFSDALLDAPIISYSSNNIVWSAITNASGYEIISDIGELPSTLTNDEIDESPKLNIASILSELEDGDYFVKIRAYQSGNTSNESPYSNVLTLHVSNHTVESSNYIYI